MFQETQMPTKTESWRGAAGKSTWPDRNIHCGYKKHHLCAHTIPEVYCSRSMRYARKAESGPNQSPLDYPSPNPVSKGFPPSHTNGLQFILKRLF